MQDIAQDTQLPSPEALTPMPRRTSALGVKDYLKHILPPMLIAAGGALGGYLVGRFAPSSFISSVTEQVLKPMEKGITGLLGSHKPAEAVTKGIQGDIVKNAPSRFMKWGGGLGSVFGAFRLWKSSERIRMGVGDIHADITDAIAPQELKRELEQNARIQEGLATIIQDGASARVPKRGSYAQEAAAENAKPLAR